MKSLLYTIWLPTRPHSMKECTQLPRDIHAFIGGYHMHSTPYTIIGIAIDIITFLHCHIASTIQGLV